MTEKRKRPKVRYRVSFCGFDPAGYQVTHKDFGDSIWSNVADCPTLKSAQRVAAALNFHEAHKRGEL